MTSATANVDHLPPGSYGQGGGSWCQGASIGRRYGSRRQGHRRRGAGYPPEYRGAAVQSVQPEREPGAPDGDPFEVSDSFDDYWNSDLAYPATALLGRRSTAEEVRSKRAGLDDLVAAQDDSAFLTDLSRRGVRVRVVTNSLASTDVPVVHSGYAKYRKRLLRAGVDLYELKSIPPVDRGGKKGQASSGQGGGKTVKKTRALGSSGSGIGGSSKASLHSKAFIFDEPRSGI